MFLFKKQEYYIRLKENKELSDNKFLRIAA